ncbi:hypothetical protein JHK87_033841 [Glycine soja]|nr:hypothetical protein JHK87_033841 [Glycine soja]
MIDPSKKILACPGVGLRLSSITASTREIPLFFQVLTPLDLCKPKLIAPTPVVAKAPKADKENCSTQDQDQAQPAKDSSSATTYGFLLGMIGNLSRCTSWKSEKFIHRQVLLCGAPEVIQDRLIDIPPSYVETYKKYTRQGSRVVALTYKSLDDMTVSEAISLDRDIVESGLTFAGFVMLIGSSMKPNIKSSGMFLDEATKFGRSIHIDEVFQQTHIRKDTGEFVDERSMGTNLSLTLHYTPHFDSMMLSLAHPHSTLVPNSTPSYYTCDKCGCVHDPGQCIVEGRDEVLH